MTIVLSTSREVRLLLDRAVRRRQFLPCGSRFSIELEIDRNSKSVTSHAAALDLYLLVVYDVFNVAMCANDLMFARWQVNEADCLSFHP